MSDPTLPPSTGTPPPTPARPASPPPAGPPPTPAWPRPAPSAGPAAPPAAPDRSAATRRWIVLAAVALAGMLVGAAIASTATVLLIKIRQPEHRYTVTVFLDLDVSAEQKRTVESALRDLDPVDGIRAQSSEQAWEKFKEEYKDQLELLDSARPDTMPESFQVTTTGREFDCAMLKPVRQLPGVDQISVIQLSAKGNPSALLDCS